ncbi:hypothetical protein ASC82_26200 [Streptomyces sp. Root431]|uniref:hypothetical protein n=1 Tax=Streptomyces sp. Root431 TaxID=1736535 RepID=UPI0006FF44F1|nr:hypothetical protein [Streptomyces sp. Root431]KQX09417.1 hypothetical protein ASC82_26200 [Streptomyces sp. Root431]
MELFIIFIGAVVIIGLIAAVRGITGAGHPRARRKSGSNWADGGGGGGCGGGGSSCSSGSSCGGGGCGGGS